MIVISLTPAANRPKLVDLMMTPMPASGVKSDRLANPQGLRSSPTMGMQRLLRHAGFVPFPDSCDAISQRVHAKADARCGELGTRAFPVTEAVRRLDQVCKRHEREAPLQPQRPPKPRGRQSRRGMPRRANASSRRSAKSSSSCDGNSPYALTPQRCAAHDGGTAAFCRR
jgi:hypothetical protein